MQTRAGRFNDLVEDHLGVRRIAVDGASAHANARLHRRGRGGAVRTRAAGNRRALAREHVLGALAGGQRETQIPGRIVGQLDVETIVVPADVVGKRRGHAAGLPGVPRAAAVQVHERKHIVCALADITAVGPAQIHRLRPGANGLNRVAHLHVRSLHHDEVGAVGRGRVLCDGALPVVAQVQFERAGDVVDLSDLNPVAGDFVRVQHAVDIEGRCCRLLRPEIRELDAQRTRLDGAGAQHAVHCLVGPVTDLLGLLRYRRRVVRNRERRVGRPVHCGIREELQHKRAAALETLVVERRFDRRNRELIVHEPEHLRRHADVRTRAFLIDAVAALGPVGPAVFVAVAVRIIDIAARVGEIELILPGVLHKVVVREHRAQREAALFQVVVRDRLSRIGLELAGIQITELVDFRNHVLGQVGEPVLVRIAQRAVIARRTGRIKVVNVLPPVGHAVAV